MKTPTDMIKHEIRQSGMSLYAISKATGLDASALGKFMAGKQSLRLDLAERLLHFFKLEVRKER
jgi:hypothetical protein